MQKWIEDIIAEWPRVWPMIKAAPRSFVVVTVTTIGFIVGVVYLVINWSYSVSLTSRDGQIAELRDQNAGLRERINTYEQKLQVASPDQAAKALKDLTDDLAETKRLLNELQHPPRDPDSIYQLGAAVANGIGSVINQGRSTVTFQTIMSFGKFDVTREAEYRNFVIQCPPGQRFSVATVGQTSSGLTGSTIAAARDVQCKILRMHN